MPPAASAGKNFSTPNPRSASAIASETVAQPGSAGTAAAASASASTAGVPGVTRNCAPALSAGSISAGLVDGADPEHDLRQLGGNGARRLERRLGAQRDLDDRQAALRERARERNARQRCARW